jgi:hypothetical protein
VTAAAVTSRALSATRNPAAASRPNSTSRRGDHARSISASAASSETATNASAGNCLSPGRYSAAGPSAAPTAARGAATQPAAPRSCLPSSHPGNRAAAPKASGSRRSRSGPPKGGIARSSRTKPTGVDEVTMRSCDSGARTEAATHASSNQNGCERR